MRISLRNRRLTSTQLKRDWNETSLVSCSSRTVMDDAGLYGRVARKKPLLTDRHKTIRLNWAKEHKDWSVDDWYRVIWSDKSKFLPTFDGNKHLQVSIGNTRADQSPVTIILLQVCFYNQ